LQNDTVVIAALDVRRAARDSITGSGRGTARARDDVEVIGEASARGANLGEE
jgi:hypothetical protein